MVLGITITYCCTFIKNSPKKCLVFAMRIYWPRFGRVKLVKRSSLMSGRFAKT